MVQATYRCHICGGRFFDVDALHKHIESDRKGNHKRRSSRNRKDNMEMMYA